ncbi:MAG: sugar acetyltransferase [Lysobacteraceae bacterium]|nr:MAG: sugar acetyltransferase [Xanthomonadaceae bacterium]
MTRVVVWGATGHAAVVREALGGTATLLALFDNRDIPSPFDGVAIHLGEAGFDDWERGYRGERPVHGCVAIGGAGGRDRLARMHWLHLRGYPPLAVLHPRAFIAADASLGAGCQVLAMAAVCTRATLGEAVIVNTGASVDHDCIVGDGAHLAPGARLAGEVVVGECAFIGTGAVVLPRIRIGAGAIVGAGAVVTRDVAADATVAGNPARLLRRNPSHA